MCLLYSQVTGQTKSSGMPSWKQVISEMRSCAVLRSITIALNHCGRLLFFFIFFLKKNFYFGFLFSFLFFGGGWGVGARDTIFWLDKFPKFDLILSLKLIPGASWVKSI